MGVPHRNITPVDMLCRARLSHPSAAARIPRKRNAAASGSNLKTEAAVLVWDQRTAEPIALLPGHGTGALSVAFSPDGTRIASGGRDGAVHVWDARAFEKIVSLTGHEGYVYHVVFDPSGRRLASVGMDGDVRLSETTTFQERDKQRRARHAIARRLTPDVLARLDAGGHPESVADNGLTSVAKQMPYAEEREKLQRVAGVLLAARWTRLGGGPALRARANIDGSLIPALMPQPALCRGSLPPRKRLQTA